MSKTIQDKEKIKEDKSKLELKGISDLEIERIYHLGELELARHYNIISGFITLSISAIVIILNLTIPIVENEPWALIILYFINLFAVVALVVTLSAILLKTTKTLKTSQIQIAIIDQILEENKENKEEDVNV